MWVVAGLSKDVGSVYRRVQCVPWRGILVLIPSEDRVVGHPAMTAMLVRFPDNDPHVREEVNAALGAALCQDGDVSREARDPGEQRQYLSLLGTPNARTCGESFQAFG